METNTHSANATHTPGPWVIDRVTDGRTGVLIRGNRRLTGAVAGVGVAKILGYKCVGAEASGNAHLIAAAPELLAQLRNIEEVATEAMIQTRLASWGYEDGNCARVKIRRSGRMTELATRRLVPIKERSPVNHVFGALTNSQPSAGALGEREAT